MADGYISQIKTPDNKVYDFRDQHLKVYTGSCTTAAATAIKDVTTDGEFTLAKGAVIFVNFSVTNSAAVGNLKLKINGEADANAKPIKYLVNGNDPANIPGAGYLRANQTYMFRYDGTNWVADLNYYTYSNDFASRIGHYNNILARQLIPAESLIVGDETGYEKVASGVTFNLAYPIVWCTAKVEAASSNYNAMFLQHYDRNIATGAKTGFTSAANKVIYLIVTINGNIATIDSNIITDTLPSSVDGKVYISLGKLGAQSTGANYFFLYPTHPMFEYKNGKIRIYEAQQNLSEIDGADDLKAIEAISGTTGLLKKTAANTWTLDTNSYSLTSHNHNSTYLKLDGSNNMTADVNIIAGDTDKFVNFWYNTNKTVGASWRTGMLGSGSGNTNYFVIQSGTSTTSATTWHNALKIGQNNYDIYNNENRIPNTGNATGSVGGTTTPVYVDAGQIKALSYTIAKSVPSDAKFTDTTYSGSNGISLSGTTFSNSGVRATTINGNYLRVNTNGTNADLTIPFATNSTNASNAANSQSNYGAKSFIVEGDADTYYPTLITGYTSHNAWTLLNITRGYSEQAPDTWNTASHKGGLTLTILSNGDSTWGGNHQIGVTKLNTIFDLSESYCTMVADISDTTFGLVIWLRGGNAKYWVTSNGGQSVSITTWYEEHTQSSTIVAPRTDINISHINSYRWNNLWSILSTQDYNNGTATKFGYSTSGMTSTSWLGSWDATVSGEYRLRAISPANAVKSAVGTTQIGGTTTPIYWTGSAFSAGTALSDGAYKSILNNTSKGALGWNSAGATNADNLRLINVNTLAYWNGAYSGTNSNLSVLGTVTTGTWNASVIGAAYGGTGQNTLQKSANALINALDTGSSDLTANDYVITQYVGGGTTTTSYHRRPASKVVNATLVKAALGTVSTTAKKFLKDTGAWTQVAFSDLSGTATNAQLANSKVTIAGNNVSLGGSLDASTLTSSLGLSSAMHYRGTSAAIPPTSGTYVSGDVLIKTDTDEEYVFDGTNWRLLGSEGSYKIKQEQVADPVASTSTSTTFIDTIQQDINGVITATKRTLPTASTSTAGIIKIGTASTDAMAGDTTVTNVSYIATTDNYEYPILMKNSTGSTTTAAGARFASGTNQQVTINPSTGTISTRRLVINNSSSNGTVPDLVFSRTSWSYINIPDNDAAVLAIGRGTGDNASQKLIIQGDGVVRPGSDNTQVLGKSTRRWKEVHGVNFYGTFNGTATYSQGLAKWAISNSDLNNFVSNGALRYSWEGGNNNFNSKPTDVNAFGVIAMKTATNWTGQLLMSTDSEPGLYWRTNLTTETPSYGTWARVWDSSNHRVFYGTCAEAAGTAAKPVVCTDYDEMKVGDMITVKFDNTNTAASPTLNVNGKGSKSVKMAYSGGTADLSSYTQLAGIRTFIYDGTNWILQEGECVKQGVTDTTSDIWRPVMLGAYNSTDVRQAPEQRYAMIHAARNVKYHQSTGTLRAPILKTPKLSIEYSFEDKAHIQWNDTDSSIDFIFD